MKTIRLFGISWFIAAIFLCFTACSSEDDEPTVEEENYIEGKLPTNAHVGMMYAISHDKKKDVCAFKIYLGENPSQEFVDALEEGRVTVTLYDKFGDRYSYKSFHHDATFGTYIDGFNMWNEQKRRSEFRHDLTFNIPCYLCEMVAKFQIRFNSGTILDYHPELADFEDVELDREIWPNPGAVASVTITQSWSAPHRFFD